MRNTISERLRAYNRWRRGCEITPQPNPTELGELIESAASRLEVLEDEHQRFFANWHSERKKRERLLVTVERCYQMLMTEPDIGSAVFKAKNILREAIAINPHLHGRLPGKDLDK